MGFATLLITIATFFIGIRSDLESSTAQGGRTCAEEPALNLIGGPYERHSFRSGEFDSARGTLTKPITENQWSTDIDNNSDCTTLVTSPGPNFSNIQYFNVGDGSATGFFICSGDGNGHNYRTEHGKSSKLSVESNNPYKPGDTLWLYYEALGWMGINNQFALDTMRLFVERFPFDRADIPSALNYDGQIVYLIADSGQYIETQDWIADYNWLVSIYNADTAAWYHQNILQDMAPDEDYFDKNGEANLLWNIERLFPNTYSTDSSGIAYIRGFQHEHNLDTTPFYIIQIPPIPYGISSVQSSVPPGITLSAVPNPVNETLTALVNITFSSSAELELYDALGQQVKSIPSPRLQMGTNEFTFVCSSLPNGSYYLRLATSQTVKTANVTIEH